jgi:hypothetical protein
MIDPETDHLMTRAQEEAILAIRAAHPAAARAHHNMAVRYSTKAVIGLAGEEDGELMGAGPEPRGEDNPV